MFQSNVVSNNADAVTAFKAISQKLEYDSASSSFSGAEFFDSMSETVVVSDFSDYDSSKTYLVAYAENILDSANKTILRQYFFNNSANKTSVPITKDLLTISDTVDSDTIIVMKKVPVNYNKYSENVPILFSIKDSTDEVVDGTLAILVDGELRGQLSKGNDNNYLGLVTYGHPGQLHNYDLTNSQATISLRNGSNSIKDLWDVWGNSFQPVSNLFSTSVALLFKLEGTGVPSLMTKDGTTYNIMDIQGNGSDPYNNPTLDNDPVRELSTTFNNISNVTENWLIYYTERIDPTGLNNVDAIERAVVLDLASALNSECTRANLTTGDAFTVSDNTIICTLDSSVLKLSYTTNSYTTNITYKITINDTSSNTLKVNYVNPNALASNTAPFSGHLDLSAQNTNAAVYKATLNSVFGNLALGLGLGGLNEMGFIDIDNNTLYITLDTGLSRVPVWFEGTGITITTLYGNKDNQLSQFSSITDPTNIVEAATIFNQWGPATSGAISLRTDEQKLKMTFQFKIPEKQYDVVENSNTYNVTEYERTYLDKNINLLENTGDYFHEDNDSKYSLKNNSILPRDSLNNIIYLELKMDKILNIYNRINVGVGEIIAIGKWLLNQDYVDPEEPELYEEAPFRGIALINHLPNPTVEKAEITKNNIAILFNNNYLRAHSGNISKLGLRIAISKWLLNQDYVDPDEPELYEEAPFRGIALINHLPNPTLEKAIIIEKNIETFFK
jgi:hypothetical protein